MREWMWQGLHVEVPDDWEMLRLSARWEYGSIAFADRYQFRLEINWKQLPGIPDFSRMLKDYKLRLKEQKKAEEIQDIHYSGWEGFHNRNQYGWNTRLGKYFSVYQRLVEMVFLWPKSIELPLINRILESFHMIEPYQGTVLWKAYGLTMRIEDGLFLDDYEVKPAHVRLVFIDGPRIKKREEFRRLGMVEEWLGCSVEEWLTYQSPQKIYEPQQKRITIQNHDIHQYYGYTPALKFPRWNRKKNAYIANAWICPFDKRLYFASCIIPVTHLRDENFTLLFGKKCCCCVSC